MNIIFFLILFSLSAFATPESRALYYQIEKGDSLGTVIFSLGYLRLWTGSAYVNKFKSRVLPRDVNSVKVGDKIFFDESEIVFKKNVEIEGERIFFLQKIRKLKDWKEMMAEEEVKNVPPQPKKITLESENETRVFVQESSSFELYTGLGGFVAQDIEVDRSTKTATTTGLQPLAQLKAVYSHLAIGSLAVDIFAKKIFNKTYSFPVNTDFRFQYIPKWIALGPVNLAVSYSMLKHSYVGKPADELKEYELTANFLGVGIVLPKGNYWYEIYFEKAMNSKTKSDEQSIDLNQGWRMDSELIYPLGQNWRFIPGFNFYTTKSASVNYQMSVFELRSTFAYEF